MTKNYPRPTFQIVTKDDTSISVGEIVYFQDGLYGVGKGLLLALTNTPLYVKSIKTDHGLRAVN